ncbi:MAG: ATP-binding protein [Lachnospiraceae bacterium]|nr:ATP-binding protein [Lachnospiraceae bacterium]
MKGEIKVNIHNNKVTYDFVLKRNITIIRGNSGTGKTTLYKLVSDYMKDNKGSGVKITMSSGDSCIALNDTDFDNQIKKTKNSVVFIDEGFNGFKNAESTNDFIRRIKNTDNYYVIFSRESFDKIPSSIEEIYEIKTNKSKHTLKRFYEINKNHRLNVNISKKDNFVLLITEDSKSSKQFFKEYYKESSIKVESANGNSNIIKMIKENEKSGLMVIVDGAAFSPYIDKVYKICKYNTRINICLPESFEWMILKSGVLKGKQINEALNNTSEIIDITKYFSWEKFFTYFLEDITKDKKLTKYEKKNISAYYLNEENMKKIAAVIGL